MITLENVSKKYGKQAALAPTSLTLQPGTTTVLIGPSGCGKSTLLRLIIGLIPPDSGRILIGGKDLTPDNIMEHRHATGYVIQEGGLFPHLTSSDNVTLLARFLRRPAGEIKTRVAELAALVQLPHDTLARYPGDLSGGQRQRIALMRALMLDPALLLLDEPLGALDPITRSGLQRELKAIFARLGKTVVMVTHDMGEAAFFGDDIVLMRDGQVLQRGTLSDLVERPADPYITEFIRAQRSPLPPLPEGRH